jgi:hypothetical protein
MQHMIYRFHIHAITILPVNIGTLRSLVKSNLWFLLILPIRKGVKFRTDFRIAFNLPLLWTIGYVNMNI